MNTEKKNGEFIFELSLYGRWSEGVVKKIASIHQEQNIGQVWNKKAPSIIQGFLQLNTSIQCLLQLNTYWNSYSKNNKDN